MDFVEKLIERFISANKRLKRWQRVVSALSAIVVFITTYSLVLPAITIDKETASTQAGMEIAAASENEPDSDGTVFEAEPEDEPEAEEQEEATEETQAEETAYEASGSDSGSHEADVSEEDTEPVEDEVGASDDDMAALVNVDGQDESKEDENSDSSDTHESEDVVEEANESITNELSEVAGTSNTAETAEKIELITEWTQLTYEYIDESFEKNEEDDVDDGYTVYAEFGADAKLPVGVELRVKEITKESDPEAYEAYYEKALSEMQDKYDENTGLSFAKFYDIAFIHEGVEVEPAGEVKIRIEYKKAVDLEKDTTVDTVHFDKNNDEKAEVIKSEINPDQERIEEAVKTVEFESDQFSVYGVVGTSSLVATFVGTDGNTYEVTVTCNADANIPSDAELIVSEVSEGSEKYNSYLTGAVEILGVEADNIAYKKLLDISIVKDGVELKPEAPVNVQIKLLDRKDESEEASLNVIHYEGESENPTVVDGTKEEEGAVQFETEGFSVYGVFYTVDFHFVVNGKMYKFVLKGGDAVSFNQLMEIFKIADNVLPGKSDNLDSEKSNEKDVNDAAAADKVEVVKIDADKLAEDASEISENTKKFLEQVEKVEFSNPELLYIEKIEKDTIAGAILDGNELTPEYPYGTTYQDFCKMYTRKFQAPDWVLISLKPFNTTESLTITMKNGDVITVKVTDDADAVIIDDPTYGPIVQTITNPSGTTIDLFDYWISDNLRYSQGMDGWPGHRGNAYTSYLFNWYDYNGNYEGNGDYTYVRDDDIVDGNKNYYVQNGHLRGNGNRQGINTSDAFKFYPGVAGTVEDYGVKKSGQNWTNNHDLYSSINSWTGTADPTTGLVEGVLNSDGYPQLTDSDTKGTDGKALNYLFDESSHAGKERYGDVDQLLYVDKDGYYTYDSRYYSAEYTDGRFVLREHAAASDSPERGFWPFGNRVNWHGMHVTSEFSQPVNGQVLNPKGEYKDMQFEFSGDDDTWIYIDGVLVGDGGGIHNRTEIDINFKTGLVTVTGRQDPNHPGTYEWTGYLDDIFRAAGKSTEDFEGHTFKPGTEHTFEMFYLERGGSESNLYLHYNLVSTTDFTAHKSYHNTDRLHRDQFQFELIGFDNEEETGEFQFAIMPGPAVDPETHFTGWEDHLGTVDSPKKVYTEASETMDAHTTLTVGVTEDGNVNFGDVQISAAQLGKEYKYVVREVVPNDATNIDGIRWDQATEEQKLEGGFSKEGITYDSKVYYFKGKVVETKPGVFELKKTRYKDPEYTEIDDETKFFSFVNGNERPITLKVIKKDKDNQELLLDGAEFSLTHAMMDENGKWVVRKYEKDGQLVPVTPKTKTTVNGIATFDNLIEGHYILEETKAPEQYKRDENYRWLLTLTKEDSATSIVLVPTIQKLDQDGTLIGDPETLVPDENNVIEYTAFNTYVTPIDIKIFKADDKGALIGDAKFELYKLNGATYVRVTKDTYSWLDNNNQFTVPKSGFTMTGMLDGTYQIKEAKAPDGYIIINNTPITFTITEGKIDAASNVLTAGVTYQAATQTELDTYTVPNTPGVELPHTGGPGTTLFTLLGAMLVAFAGFGMIRMKSSRR